MMSCDVMIDTAHTALLVSGVSSGDEDERTEERRVFKRDFLAMLEARILGVRERRRHVILVSCEL